MSEYQQRLSQYVKFTLWASAAALVAQGLFPHLEALDHKTMVADDESPCTEPLTIQYQEVEQDWVKDCVFHDPCMFVHIDDYRASVRALKGRAETLRWRLDNAPTID